MFKVSNEDLQRCRAHLRHCLRNVSMCSPRNHPPASPVQLDRKLHFRCIDRFCHWIRRRDCHERRLLRRLLRRSILDCCWIVLCRFCSVFDRDCCPSLRRPISRFRRTRWFNRTRTSSPRLGIVHWSVGVHYSTRAEFATRILLTTSLYSRSFSFSLCRTMCFALCRPSVLCSRIIRGNKIWYFSFFKHRDCHDSSA